MIFATYAAVILSGAAASAEPAPAAPAQAKPAADKPFQILPTTALAKLPFLANPKLSPDGTHVAARVILNNRELMAVFDLAAGTSKLINPGEKLDLNWYRWAGNDRVLISVGSMVPWLGDEVLQTRLVAFDVSTQAQRFIGGKTEGATGDDVLWIDPEGQSILLSFQQTIYDYPSVSRIDLAKNRAKQVVAPRDDLWDWYADEKGVVRAGFIFSDDTWKMIYREKDGDSFRTVMKADIHDREAGCIFYRIYQASDDGYCIMYNEANGRDALFRYNFATRKRGDLVFEAPGVNVDDFDTKFESPDLLAAWYTDDRPRAHWFDAELAELQTSIDKAVAGAVGDRMATIVSYTRDHSRLIVHVGGSNDPGRYYVFDQADGTMKLFAEANDKLRPAQLTPTTYTRYKGARRAGYSGLSHAAAGQVGKEPATGDPAAWRAL